MRSRLNKLEAVFGSAIQVKNFGRSELLMVEVELKRLIEVSAWLRMEESFRMDFVENISIYEINDRYIVSYFLRSHPQNLQLVLRTSFMAPAGNSIVEHPSVTGIWSQAEPFEVEQEALFGVHFSGRTIDQRVKRNFGDFSGYPLRKTFEWGEKVDF